MQLNNAFIRNVAYYVNTMVICFAPNGDLLCP